MTRQNELDARTLALLSEAWPYDPASDRFANAAVALRIEERWPDGVLGARIALKGASWRALPNLPPELARDEDIEDAFLGMATRLPANFIEFLTGATLRYDTNSFIREEDGAPRYDYRAQGTAEGLIPAARELERASDIRAKKAYRMMLGYAPGGEEHSDERAGTLLDRIFGSGTADRWSSEVAEYDAKLAAFFQERTLSRLPPPPPPETSEIRFTGLIEES